MTTKTYPEWVRTESEKKLHDDFRYFLWFIWKHQKLPEPTKRQLAIASYVAKGPQRRMVQAWRGAAKTWITCAYALWRLYRNPNERIKIVSANEDKALENAVFIRRLIEEVEQLQFLRPKGKGRDSSLKFDVGPSDAHPTPSVSCVGITGQLTGGRATILISDDVEVPKNSMHEGQRELLAELVKEYEALVLPEGFDIIILGTPQTEQSIYRALKSRGYDCRVWPVLYPEKPEKYEGCLAPDIVEDLRKNPALVGTSVEPTRFTDLDLAGRAGSYGKSGFALQFLMDTSLSDAERYPLKTADFICMDVDVEVGPAKVVWSSDPRLKWEDIHNVGFNGDRLFRPMYVSDTMLEYQGRVLVIDPSGRGKDETSYAVLFHLNGTLFLKDFGGFTAGYADETLQSIADTAKKYKVNTVLVESNFGDGMFSQLLKPVLAKTHPCTMEEVRAQGQKERRIIADLEPVMNTHRLIVDACAARKDVEDGAYSLMYQLTHITKDRGALKQDDRADALAHAVRHFWDRLARDTQSAEEEHLEKLRNEQMEEFRRTWFKRTPKAKPGFAMTNRGLRR